MVGFRLPARGACPRDGIPDGLPDMSDIPEQMSRQVGMHRKMLSGKAGVPGAPGAGEIPADAVPVRRRAASAEAALAQAPGCRIGAGDFI
tara:strand:- start:5987 stop:6256 length:270 start_codon:yes stop_codon:yes gene_type:complete